MTAAIDRHLLPQSHIERAVLKATPTASAHLIRTAENTLDALMCDLQVAALRPETIHAINHLDAALMQMGVVSSWLAP